MNRGGSRSFAAAVDLVRRSVARSAPIPSDDASVWLTHGVGVRRTRGPRVAGWDGYRLLGQLVVQRCHTRT
jgi:hypothetical protein